MACSKYTLTNTGSTIVNFNYRRCDDSLWEYQVELNPNQTKNIWLINGTYSIAPVYTNSIVLFNQGVFPPISQTATPTPTPSTTPTNTPTPSVTAQVTSTPTPTSTITPTPSVTAQVTSTPTPTPSITPTQTNTPTRPLTAFVLNSGTTSNNACSSVTTITLYGLNPLFDQNLQFFNNSNGTVTINLTGFFSNGSAVTQLDSNGAQVGTYTLCSGLPTQTPTQTTTPSPTPTFGYFTYSLGYGPSPGEACEALPSNVYAPVSGGTGPNIGETLYSNTSLTLKASDGYYSNGTAWYIITGGEGIITTSDPNGCV